MVARHKDRGNECRFGVGVRVGGGKVGEENSSKEAKRAVDREGTERGGGKRVINRSGVVVEARGSKGKEGEQER